MSSTRLHIQPAILTGLLLSCLCSCGEATSLDIASQDNSMLTPSSATPYAATFATVVNLTIINRQTGETVQTIDANTMVNLAALPADIDIRAVTSPSQVGSVRFDLDDQVGYHTENNAPYTMLGKLTGSLSKYIAPGEHVITVTPFSDGNLQGASGAPMTVTFLVDANTTATQDGNATPPQNGNTSSTQNANSPASLAVTHIYDFTMGVSDQSPNATAAIDGTLVGNAAVNNGTLVTSLTPSTSGMRLPSSTFAHYTGSFTIEQWFTWSQSADDYESVFSVSTDSDHGIMAHPRRADNTLFSVDLHPGDGHQYSVTAPSPVAGALIFMAVVYDATTRKLTLYMDGTQADATTVASVNLSALAGPNFTGVNGFSPFSDPAFNGSTARFVTQPVALTAAQVAQDAANPAAAGGAAP